MDHLDPQVYQKIFELGVKAAGPQMAPNANVPYVMEFDADGHFNAKPMPELVFNTYEKALPRIKQIVQADSPMSFCDYHRQFANEYSQVFADEAKMKAVAFLDYHEGGADPVPHHCAHKLVLSMKTSVQWQTWIGSNNKRFTQGEFAEFLEQNAIDIRTPAPADIMEVARDLQATTEVDFGSAIRNNDGQVRFRYSEQVKATVGGGAIAVPETFTLEIPVFVGSNDSPVNALLRFRVNSGKLQIWYTLVRPEEVLRQGFIAAKNYIATELGITIIDGNAE